MRLLRDDGQVVLMKGSHIIVVLLIFAWPLNYLYQRQLGAVSFLLLAIFFFVISIREIKKLRKEKNDHCGGSPEEKIK
jgi:ABC-type iron transport system FetAB permease component